MSLWGTLSDERSGLSIVIQSLQYLVVCQYILKYLHFRCLTYKFVFIHCESELSTAIYALAVVAHATMAV
jgi:hypothetical protein